MLCHWQWKFHQKLYQQNIQKIYQTIIARDFYNNSASRFSTRFRYTSETKKIWINHVNNAFTNSDIIGINFNKWFQEEKYRYYLTKEFNIPFTDSGLNDVHGYGSSTFDNKKYNGKAQKMDVLNRWKNFKSNPEYWNHINYTLKFICKQYFNMEITIP